MLSALVVRSADYRPGKGMYDLARGLGRMKAEDAGLEWWNVEIEELRRYWAAQPDDPIKDTQFDALMAELATIKRMIRAVMHG